MVRIPPTVHGPLFRVGGGWNVVFSEMPTHRASYLKRHGLKSDAALSLSQIAKTSGVRKACLQKVYDRGVGAYHTNPDSVRTQSFQKGVHVPPSRMAAVKLSKEQWAMARVYAFLDKIEGKQKLNHDTDLKECVTKKR